MRRLATLLLPWEPLGRSGVRSRVRASWLLGVLVFVVASVVVLVGDVETAEAVGWTTPQSPGVTTRPMIATGFFYSGALKADGTVHTWGSNTYGQLGDGSTTTRATSGQVLVSAGTPLQGVVSISLGTYTGYAVKADGTVWAWGYNKEGQLGNGSATGPATCGTVACSMFAVQVRTSNTGPTYLTRVKSISSAGLHVAAVRDDGTVWSWGYNAYGTLAQGTNNVTPSPLAVEAQASGSARLTNVVAVAGGGEQTLALKNDGTVWAWGRNVNGELGVGTSSGPVTCTSNSSPCSHYPVQVMESATGKLTNVVAVSGGGTSSGNFSMALKVDGSVYMWGANGIGQLGQGSTTGPATCAVACSPYAVPVKENATTPLTGVTAISAGGNHAGAVKAGGTLWLWGQNNRGQLAVGTTADNPWASSARQSASAFTTEVQSLALGGATTAVSKPNGTVWTAGRNVEGQLGNGTTTGPNSCSTVVCGWYTVQNSFSAGTGSNAVAFTSISTRCNYSLGVRVDGSVWAWGSANLQQLGYGFATDTRSPVQVYSAAGVPLSRIKAVSAGCSHGLALDVDGKVWAWGDDSAGQVGDGTAGGTSTYASLVQVASGDLTNVVTIAAGGLHSLALRYGIDGGGNPQSEVRAWGSDTSGQLGDGSSGTGSARALKVLTAAGTDLSNVFNIAAASSHSLALRYGVDVSSLPQSEIRAWGDDSLGQLGDGTAGGTVAWATTKVLMAASVDLSGAIELVGGGNHSLALRRTGSGTIQSEIRAWGSDAAGQLGDGTVGGSGAYAGKMQASSGVDFVDIGTIAAGLSHSLALNYVTSGTATSRVFGWGDGAETKLGNGVVTGSAFATQSKATASTFITDATTVQAGTNHSLVVRADGTGWDWGDGAFGQLGNCLAADQTYYVQVVQCTPGTPSTLVQKRPDGSTIATNDWTNTAVLSFNVVDIDALDPLTPWVEVGTSATMTRGCGTAGAGLYSGTPVTTGISGATTTLSVTVSGLASGTYFWRACAVDRFGKVSAWTTAAGSPADFRVDTVAPTPNASTGSSVANSASQITWMINAATDTGGSGLNATAYSFDGGSTWQASNTLVESTGLTANTQYTRTIMARDAAGNMTTGTALSASTFAIAPTLARFGNASAGVVNPSVASGTALTNAASPRLGWQNNAGTTVDKQVTEVYTTPLDSSVVDLWHLDGDGASTGTSPRTMVPSNGAGYSAGRTGFGQAMSFDGIDDHAQTGVDSAYDLDTYTVELWFQTGDLSSSTYPVLISKGCESLSRNFIIGFDTDGSLAGSFSTGGTTRYNLSTTAGVSMADSKWHHVAMTVDGAGTSRIYVDGRLEQTTPYAGDVDNTTGRGVELGSNCGLPYGNQYRGLIDEVRISNVARSASEIAGYYKTSQPHGKLLWTSDATGTGVDLTTTGCATGTRCADITYAGAAGSLNYGSARYYARAKFRTSVGTPSEWSAYDWFEIQDSLTVSLDTASLSFGSAMAAGDTASVGSTVSVTTNNHTGYLLTVSDTSDSGAMQLGTSSTWINDFPNPILDTPAAWASESGMGLTVLSVDGAKDAAMQARWGTGTTCASGDYPNLKYVGLKTTSTTVNTRPTYDPANPSDQIAACYRVKIPTGQAAGTYTSTITYTATAHP